MCNEKYLAREKEKKEKRKQPISTELRHLFQLKSPTTSNKRTQSKNTTRGKRCARKKQARQREGEKVDRAAY